MIRAVLSDSNKRFLYDVGVYNSEDDEADVIPAPGSINFSSGFTREENSIAYGVFCSVMILSCRGWATSSERWPT
jgi:hypothetical protein